MGSWKCSLCPESEDEEKTRWPTKQQAMDHIEENHIETLIRASLERSSKDPTEDLTVKC